jgi:hypothetical protein
MTYEKQTREVLERLKGNKADLEKQAKQMEKLFLKWNKKFDRFLLTFNQ